MLTVKKIRKDTFCQNTFVQPDPSSRVEWFCFFLSFSTFLVNGVLSKKNESIFVKYWKKNSIGTPICQNPMAARRNSGFFRFKIFPSFFSGLIRKWTTSEVHSFVHNSSQTWNFKGKTFSLLDTTESESSSPCDWSRLIATEWHELITCYDAPIFKHTCSSQESFHQSFIFLNDGSRRKIVLLLLGSIGLTGHGPRYQSQVVRAVPCRARWFVFDSSSINACRYFGGV